MRSEPFKGDVVLSNWSGLRKLMRAARRGMMPSERQQVIDTALEKAAKRKHKYTHSAARRRSKQ